MKKVINVKEIIIVLISVVLITICTTASATGSLNLGGNNNTPTPVLPDEYQNAQDVPQNNTNTNININANNSTNNSSNNKVNNTKVYNTNNTSDLPQTGIEDYNIGILLIICVASAIYAYKKVNDYRSI